MRIALDYTAGIRQGAGVGQYFAQSGGRHARAGYPQQIYINCQRNVPRQHIHSLPPTMFKTAASASPITTLTSSGIAGTSPSYANYFTGPTDIYHGLDFALPPISGKTRKIVTVYDPAFVEHPEAAVPSLVAYLNKVVPASVAAADVVAAIPYATRQTLIEHYKTPPENTPSYLAGSRPIINVSPTLIF